MSQNIKANGLLAVFSCATLATLSCASMALNDPATCWGTYIAALQECNNQFDNPPGTGDPAAHAACVEGAGVGIVGCGNGGDAAALAAAWQDFLDRLRECETTFPNDATLREACFSAALELYRIEVRDIVNPPVDPEPVPGQTRLFPSNPDALPPTYTAGSSTAFRAGTVDPKPFSYRIERDARATQAILIAAYETADGTVVTPIDASTTARNGAGFRLSLPASALVHADKITLLSVFYDAHAMPIFAERTEIIITDTGLPGDWNRDGVVNARDRADFVVSYNAQVGRADVNADGRIDAADLAVFVSHFGD